MKSLKIWINAFIPKDLPGYTETVLKGPYSGETMVHGPIESINDCFLTDQRTFSSQIDASSRLHSQIEIDLATLTEVQNSEFHDCSYTIEVDCEDGEEECKSKGKTSRMHFYHLRAISSTELGINVDGRSSNPCFTFSPDVFYSGILRIVLKNDSGSVSFNGMIGGFPAYEMYISLDGNIIQVFNSPPPPGNTPASLLNRDNDIHLDIIHPL